MSINLFTISKKTGCLEIFSVFFTGYKERALLHISEDSFEIFFIKIK